MYVLDRFKQFRIDIKANTEPLLGNDAEVNDCFEETLGKYKEDLKKLMQIEYLQRDLWWFLPGELTHPRIEFVKKIEAGQEVTTDDTCMYVVEKLDSDFFISAIELLSYHFTHVELYRTYSMSPFSTYFVCECSGNLLKKDRRIFGKSVKNKGNIKNILLVCESFYSWLIMLCEALLKADNEDDLSSMIVVEGYIQILIDC